MEFAKKLFILDQYFQVLRRHGLVLCELGSLYFTLSIDLIFNFLQEQRTKLSTRNLLGYDRESESNLITSCILSLGVHFLRVFFREKYRKTIDEGQWPQHVRHHLNSCFLKIDSAICHRSYVPSRQMINLRHR
jgi:hypothetical protein